MKNEFQHTRRLMLNVIDIGAHRWISTLPQSHPSMLVIRQCHDRSVVGKKRKKIHHHG